MPVTVIHQQLNGKADLNRRELCLQPLWRTVSLCIHSDFLVVLFTRDIHKRYYGSGHLFVSWCLQPFALCTSCVILFYREELITTLKIFILVQVSRVCACAGGVQNLQRPSLTVFLWGKAQKVFVSVITCHYCSTSVCAREQSSGTSGDVILAIHKWFLCSLSKSAMCICRANKLNK